MAAVWCILTLSKLCVFMVMKEAVTYCNGVAKWCVFNKGIG